MNHAAWSVEGAKLYDFQNSYSYDILIPGELGENAVVGSDGEVHLLHGVFEVTLTF